MSLTQQGIQTARKRKKNIAMLNAKFMLPESAMIMWNNDAQVLKRTCSECGSRVFGQK